MNLATPLGDNVERSIGRLEGKLDSAVQAMTNVASEVKSLRDDFASMEKGRLSKLEVGFATLSTEVSTKARNWGAMWAIISSVVSSVLAGVIIFLVLGSR